VLIPHQAVIVGFPNSRSAGKSLNRPTHILTEYECGRDSAAVMRELTRDRRVECESRDRDRYGRVIAVCRTESGEINAAIMRRGWAVDWPRYSNGRYQADESAARAEGLGIWFGRFEMPWEWRQERRRGPAPRSRIE